MENNMKLWAVSRFGVSELSPFAIGSAPWGGDDLVEAKDRQKAQSKWFDYLDGKRLKGTAYRVRPYPVKNVIV